MTISIIIPTLNEALHISGLLSFLKQHSYKLVAEIIVVDGGSSDNTLGIALREGAIVLKAPQRGRAIQMNYAARRAKGDILYFIHADAIPPATFAGDIIRAVKQGFSAGCYRFRFNSDKILLKVNAFFTRFDRIMCRGGDQTLFVTRLLFQLVGGYNNNFLIMEDYDFIQRVQKVSPFKIIPKSVIVSARKYDKNSYLKVNIANFIVFMLYFMGCSQERMINFYKKMLQS